MTIDERLEAIAQHVELLSAMQLKTEEHVEQLRAMQIKTEQGLNRMEQGLNRMTRGLNRLRKYALIIAVDHESRIAALEAAIGDDDENGEGN